MIRAHIPSVWALELILLLRRTADRDWLPEQLSQELRATVQIVTSCMDYFERVALVVRDDAGRYRYARANEVMDRFCAELEAEYLKRPVAVISLIAAPPDRIQELADAFRFRGRKTP